MRTEQTIDVYMEVELCIWLHDYSRHNQAILVPCSDGLHEAGGAQGFFILQISQFWDVDVGGASRECGEGKALAHGGG
jgi:hypothetical protein